MPDSHAVTLRAIEPISHGDTATGVGSATNTRLFMRSPERYEGSMILAPKLSENSLRSRIFRASLADHLLDYLEIGKKELPQAVMNLLYSGGNLAGGSTAPGNEVDLGHRVRELYPSLHLLGGATDSFILPESALKLASWPIAREFRFALSYIAPTVLDEADELSVYDLLYEETRTRGTSSNSSGNQTLYVYEVLASGTGVVMEPILVSRTPDPVRAAAGLALSEWDGYFGGQGRQGRGRMVVEDYMEVEARAYLEHLEQYADTMRAGLLDGTLGTGKPLCVLA